MDFREMTEQQQREIIDKSGYNADDREDWLIVGMAIKDCLGESGYNLYDDWSRQSGKYDATDQERVWKSFSGGNTQGETVTVGTLIKRAIDNGYKFPKSHEESYDPFKNATWEELEGEVYLTDTGAEFRKKGVKVLHNGRVVQLKPENQKKIESEKTRPNQPKQKNTNNNITKETDNDEDLERLIKALTEYNGTFTELIDKAQANLYNKPEAQECYAKRGISQDTTLHYSAGWVENYGRNNITGPLIAGTSQGFAIRNINYEAQIEEFNKLSEDEQKRLTKAGKKPVKYYKPSTKKNKDAMDIPVGLKFVIQEPDLRDEETGYKLPVFIFEGYFDVLSLYEATGIDGISLNGIGNVGTIIKAFKHFGVDRPIILALDNDATGKANNQKRYNDFKDAGFNVTWIKDFYGKYKDANEYLTEDKQKFVEAVAKAKVKPYEEFTKDLNIANKEGFLKHIKQSKNRKTLATGFKTLDGEGFLNGGLRAGLYGIGALSSLGKTSFILQMADNLAKDGNPVLYFSLEMSRYELMAKSISRYTYEYSYDQQTRQPYMGFTTIEILDAKRQESRVEYELDHLEQCTDLYFNDTGNNLRIIEVDGEITVSEIREEVRKQVALTGKAPVVIVDYLQLIAQPPDIKHSITDKQLIDLNVKNLKDISRVYHTPVIFISSFNRQSNNKESEFESFLGSSGIEYSADVLLSLQRNITLTEKQKKGDKREEFFYNQSVAYAKYKERVTGIKWLKLKVLKNRTGQALGEVGLKFNAKYNAFYDCGEIYPETGTNETAQEEAQRIDDQLHGRKTKDAPPEENIYREENKEKTQKDKKSAIPEYLRKSFEKA